MAKGSIRMLIGLIAASIAGGDHKSANTYQQQKNTLILNGNGPYVGRLPNQRQKRKRLRQVPQLRNK